MNILPSSWVGRVAFSVIPSGALHWFLQALEQSRDQFGLRYTNSKCKFSNEQNEINDLLLYLLFD
jgi:hypothetical protein